MWSWTRDVMASSTVGSCTNAIFRSLGKNLNAWKRKIFELLSWSSELNIFIIMCNAMMSLYFFGAIFSSGLKCNIVVCYAVFAKSRILIYAWAFMIYDSNIKHKNNHNKQHQFYFSFFLLPFQHKKLLMMFCIIETENTGAPTSLIARVWHTINQRSNVTQSRAGSSWGLELLMIKSVQYQSLRNLSK